MTDVMCVCALYASASLVWAEDGGIMFPTRPFVRLFGVNTIF